MNSAHFGEKAFDVLLDVHTIEGSNKAKAALLSKRVMFEGVHSEKQFFVGDDISFLYREEFGPRNFVVETVSPHETFVDIVSSLER